MLKIKINTDYAAFKDEYTGEDNRWSEGQELNRCLRKIIEGIEDGRMYGNVHDLNGNKVGSWSRM